MRAKRFALPALVIALLGFVVWYLVFRAHFDWAAFGRQLRSTSPLHIALGILFIYIGFLFRSWRWSVFLRPRTIVPSFSLTGTQMIGFTAVALFGRLADLSRPYLVAKRVRSSVAEQIAVYTVERMFDMGAAALIFSSALAFAPKDMPHHELFSRIGIFSLAGVLFLAAVAFVVRVAGVAVAHVVRRVLGSLSAPLAESVAEKILAFREGLDVISSIGEFLLAAVLSLAMWGLIAGAYVQSTHAFTHEPTLAALSFPQTMLLMAVSIGGSAIQLPIVGWFTQIAVTAAAMHAFYGTPLEPATGCGALLLIITFLSVIPGGLICAQLQSVSLSSLGKRSAEAAAEETA
ncbi:MAG: flippase-like domain-containing protein [Acidobacteria bacterium]|nr:flippase-like domain-containing protein [Acidobacteriota bacterium]